MSTIINLQGNRTTKVSSGFNNLTITSAASIKTFSRIQYQHAYLGNSVVMTNTQGNTLIGAFSNANDLGTKTFQDTNGNTWNTITNVVTVSDQQTVAIATNINGGSNTISATAAFDGGITVIEYSPCELEDFAGANATSMPSLEITTTKKCFFLLCWSNNRNPYGGVPNVIINPGGITLSTIQIDAGHFDGQFEFLNTEKTGYSPGTYTLTGNDGAYAPTCLWVLLALK